MIPAGQLLTPSSFPRTHRPISLRSTEMSHVLHEELARAHIQQRLQRAERAREVAHHVRLAKARRSAQRAERAAERAQLRLRLLVS